MKMHFTERMEKITELVPKCKAFADIGADHALVSISVALSGKADIVYACDINEGPIEVAKKNIEKFSLVGKVIPILSDGLTAVYDKVDACLIAGLGGDVIASILEKDDISGIETFILQPMSRAENLRKRIYALGLKIDDEVLLEDMGRIYVIIKASKGKGELSDFEAFIGPKVLEKKNDKLFIPYIEKNLRYAQSKAKGDDKMKPVVERLEKLIKEML